MSSLSVVCTSAAGKAMHQSVGALICRDGKYLLINRALPPPGFACVSGHVDCGETPEQALAREVQEESGLVVTSSSLVLHEQLDWNTCKEHVDVHEWFIFSCTVSGRVRFHRREVLSGGWYTRDDLSRLILEPVWHYFLCEKKLM
jgi:NADH pyrophosphatase NudC (nudix superfamily)